MAIYGFGDILLGFFACAAIASASAALFLYWHPLFRTVRNSCEAGFDHPVRKPLLYFVALTPTAWILAFVIYIRNLFALWHLMAHSLNDGAVGSIMYMIKNGYLLLIVLSGFAGVAGTLWFAYDHRQDLNDIVMIVKFRSGDYRNLYELEAQELSTASELSHNEQEFDAAVASDPDSFIFNESRRRRSLHRSFSDRLGGADFPNQRRKDVPIGKRFRKGAYYMQIAKDLAADTPTLDSDGNPIIPSPSSPSPTDASDHKPNSPKSDHGDEDGDEDGDGFDPYFEAFPRPLRLQFSNLDGISERPLSRCSSCSESHTSTIPHTRRTSVREPLTPTSPTGNFGSSAMSSSAPVSSSDGGIIVPDGHATQEFGLLLAGINAGPTQSDVTDVMDIASTVSRFDDKFPDILERCGSPTSAADLARSKTLTDLPESNDTESLQMPPTPRLEPMEKEWDPLDKPCEMLKSVHIRPEDFIAGVSEDLRQEAKKEYRDHKMREHALTQQRKSLKVNDMGQAMTAALALQRRNQLPDPLPPRRPLPRLSVLNVAAPLPVHRGHPRPTRILTDPRYVDLRGATDHPRTLILTPRSRVSIPDASRSTANARLSPQETHTEKDSNATLRHPDGEDNS